MDAESAQHLDNLIRLAGEKSPEKRRALLEEISDLFFANKDEVNERESALMGDILKQLVHDVEMSVRQNLAERLADVEEAPYDLVNSLANDEIDVAAPILMRSGVLQDSDLIEIAKHRTQEHMLAMARREALSEEVSDALVDNGNEDVIETLLNNHNALISRRAMSYLAEQSKRVDRLQRPMLRRPDLPSEIAYDMFDWVSSALRQHILSSYQLDESLIDAAIETSRDAFLGEDTGAKSVSEAEKLVQRLESAGMLTENFLVQSLRDGRVDVFLTALAQKSSIDIKTARRIFFDRGEEGLSIACRAAGFDRSTFASLVMLSQRTVEKRGALAPTALERILSFYDSLAPREAQRVLRFWNLRQREAVGVDDPTSPFASKGAVAG